ncbi:type VI secretion system baseplate subunit TssG [Arcobacter sp. FWKO B]|uniref:type VI secretion system baseplate subunit TssG n=1 Tax=Arcobacter sp. FWKO B TaxID=2593672 RepID=UPI0018A4F35B|nr:type VI secretion system baseplate subunit TssG [Arcobacter sp. FWKO B]QOG11552.1 type VI secretion system baseplate subunit TssG [Arcobacter sp. FWKO B]
MIYHIDTINQKLSTIKHKISLAQAVRISLFYLKNIYPKLKVDELYRKILFKSNTSLSFQKSELADIQFITQQENQVYAVFTVNFLSLFGSSSPLPAHYSETVLRDTDENGNLRDFMNIFNHNLQKFIYPIWQKHRYSVVYQKDFKDYFSKYVISIIGLYSEHQAHKTNLDMNKIAPYIGLLSMKQKSSGMLKAILKHYLNHKDIDIKQCQISNIEIPSWQYCSLGQQNCVLGTSTIIGTNAKSRNMKFSIELKNSHWDNLREYSIYGEKLNQLNELVNFILKEPLVYDLIINVPQKNIINSKLSDERCAYLGINSVIGESTSNLQIAFA